MQLARGHHHRVVQLAQRFDGAFKTAHPAAVLGIGVGCAQRILRVPHQRGETGRVHPGAMHHRRCSRAAPIFILIECVRAHSVQQRQLRPARPRVTPRATALAEAPAQPARLLRAQIHTDHTEPVFQLAQHPQRPGVVWRTHDARRIAPKLPECPQAARQPRPIKRVIVDGKLRPQCRIRRAAHVPCCRQRVLQEAAPRKCRVTACLTRPVPAATDARGNASVRGTPGATGVHATDPDTATPTQWPRGRCGRAPAAPHSLSDGARAPRDTPGAIPDCHWGWRPNASHPRPRRRSAVSSQCLPTYAPASAVAYVECRGRPQPTWATAPPVAADVPHRH
eukprot:ctg_1213.g380